MARMPLGTGTATQPRSNAYDGLPLACTHGQPRRDQPCWPARPCMHTFPPPNRRRQTECAYTRERINLPVTAGTAVPVPAPVTRQSLDWTAGPSARLVRPPLGGHGCTGLTPPPAARHYTVLTTKRPPLGGAP